MTAVQWGELRPSLRKQLMKVMVVRLLIAARDSSHHDLVQYKISSMKMITK